MTISNIVSFIVVLALVAASVDGATIRTTIRAGAPKGAGRGVKSARGGEGKEKDGKGKTVKGEWPPHDKSTHCLTVPPAAPLRPCLWHAPLSP